MRINDLASVFLFVCKEGELAYLVKGLFRDSGTSLFCMKLEGNLCWMEKYFLGNKYREALMEKVYYGALCTEVYESDKSVAYDKELAFYLSFADKTMKVLEPMCGNGRMLLPFMQAGINIDGFDMSDEMLRMCKEKGRKLSLEPNVEINKIEDFHTDKKYDLVMIPIGSFSLLPNNLVDRSLQNMKSVLQSDGRLLITIVTTPSEVEEIPEWVKTNEIEMGQGRILEYRKVHFQNKELFIQLKYESLRNGQVVKTELMDFPIQVYELGEFEQVLKKNGFKEVVIHTVEDGYGDGNAFHVFECSY